MVYFVRLPTGTIKIGFSKDLTSRFNALRGTYGKIEVLKTQEGNRQTERALHRRFEHLRIRRTEQFLPGQELLEFLGSPQSEASEARECPKRYNVVQILLPRDDWMAIRLEALETGRTASAIIQELVATHLQTQPVV